MKVSISWLKELVDFKILIEELVLLLPMRTIGLKDVTSDFIELDMKGYNRADLLSMRGVAREVAAITKSQINFNDPPKLKSDLPKTKIKIEDPKLCPVYCIAKIDGLKAGPSKPEWVKKLADSGMRSVNNIADVTNLVMLEYGQPMHSFDARGVKDETLIVRRAKPGERITTLDGKTRDLDPSDLLIADSQNALGIAGVMGGKDSEASESTTTILLEAAIFDPISIRRTAQRHSLYSEASKRFQHGLTRTNLLQALSAAIKMYEELGGKLTAISLVGDLEDEPKKIKLTQKKVNELIGIEIPPKEVEKYLQSLGFHLRGIGTNSWEITVPYWRLDINIEEDLVEEVARMYGYEKIAPQELRGKLPEQIDQSLYDLIYNLKKTLADAGFTEVQTYSFYSSQVLEALGFDEAHRDTLIRVANPISKETEYMRAFIWPNLVEAVGKNLRQGFNDIAIFEIGKTYYASKSNPKEEYRLSAALLNCTENPISELYQIFEKIVKQTGLKISLGDPIGESAGRFHPTRYIYLTYRDKPIGKIGEVHPRILNKFGIEKRVAIFEIDLIDLISN